jgi:hypothetical protein
MEESRTVTGPNLGGSAVLRGTLLIGVFAALTVLLAAFAAPFFFLVYLLVDVAFVVLWYRRLLGLTRLSGGLGIRWFAGMLPPACAALVLAVLWAWADSEVRAVPVYQVAFLIAWGAAMIWAHLVSSLIGLNCLEQGLEGRNPAVVRAWAGLMLGTTLTVAGANIGQGPTEATTLVPMVMAVAALLGLWAMFAALTGSTASVALERDRPSGWRLAGLLVAWGLILGRSVAGDWVSLEATLRDFWRDGLRPALVLLALAAVVELWERPRRRRPFPPVFGAGVIPAGLFLGFSLVWLWWVGAW